MYGDDLASVYDQIYIAGGMKDYAVEAAALTELVRSRCPSAASVLDVACGTGEHLRYLVEHFDRAEGLEIAAPMRAIAVAKLPGVAIHAGDMRDFALDSRFDAVVCLFSAIGYMRSPAELRAAIAAMAAHLNPGGVLVVEPWVYPERWREGMVSHNVAMTADRTVVRMSRSAMAGSLSRLDNYYLVGEASGVRYFTDAHELSLFTEEEHLDAFTAAGLTDVGTAPGWTEGRPRIVGTKAVEG